MRVRSDQIDFSRSLDTGRSVKSGSVHPRKSRVTSQERIFFRIRIRTVVESGCLQPMSKHALINREGASKLPNTLLLAKRPFCCDDNMRGLVLSLAAGEAGWRRAEPRPCLCKCRFQITLRYNSTVVVFSEDAVGVELPSVIRQLESCFRPSLWILDLT